jgi:hypothetical protein
VFQKGVTESPTHILADQYGGRHRKAEQCGEHQEHDQPRIGRRGERFFPQKLANPDRIHRIVQRLQYVNAQRRQRKQEQCLGNRSNRQATLMGRGTHGVVMAKLSAGG